MLSGLCYGFSSLKPRDGQREERESPARWGHYGLDCVKSPWGARLVFFWKEHSGKVPNVKWQAEYEMTYSRQAGERQVLYALIFPSSSCPVPISAAARCVDGCVASLPQFSSSLSSVNLFLHTPPIPLMSPDSGLGRSHCWCYGLPAAPADCGHPGGPEGKGVSPCGIQLPCICWLYPKQMDKAQDEGCSKGSMVPFQRLRDAAS